MVLDNPPHVLPLNSHPEHSHGWYEPKPIEQRPSQHVEPFDFAKRFVSYMAAGALSACAFAGAAKITGIKVKTPELMQKAGKYMGLVWQSEHLTPSGWAAIGAKVGIAIKGYMHWTEAEGERVGINDMYQELVPTLRQQPTSAQVVDDSELVRDMIAYERRQQQSLQAQLSPITQVAVKPALHHGMVKDVSKIELHSV